MSQRGGALPYLGEAMASGQYKKTGKRATKRRNVTVDTRNIKDGEVRIGPKGERNVFDKKTGRWYRATKRRPLTLKSKKTTSGTVTSAKPKKRPENLGLGGGTSDKKSEAKDTSRRPTYNPGGKQTKGRTVRGKPRGVRKFRLTSPFTRSVGSRVNPGKRGSRRDKMQRR